VGEAPSRGVRVYVNTGNPAPRSDFYWPASGFRDPALCRDNTSTRDPGCAYDYSWHAAAKALAVADRVDPGLRSRTWWLDVEKANSWNGDGIANTADLQGALDLLRSKGVTRVGRYSTATSGGRSPAATRRRPRPTTAPRGVRRSRRATASSPRRCGSPPRAT
jgi:hypothetical protein